MENMAAVPYQEKKLGEKLTRKTTNIRTRSGKTGIKETKEDLNNELGETQTLTKEIATRDHTIEILRRELNDVIKHNKSLKKELEDLRGNTYTQDESTIIETNSQHVVGLRKHRACKSRTETKTPTKVTTTTPKIPQSSCEKPDTKNYQDLVKKVIDESLDERRFQDEERKRRAPNIIIHGIKEEPDENLNQTAKKFLDIFEVTSAPKYAARLGKVKPRTTRPLKITFNNAKEKEKVMKALPKLKNSEMKVHVTHDYTIMDRKKISSWNQRARKKNMEETGSHVWRVTGSPATTLRLTKFEKKNATHKPVMRNYNIANNRNTIEDKRNDKDDTTKMKAPVSPTKHTSSS